jgi:hypothetical protein
VAPVLLYRSTRDDLNLFLLTNLTAKKKVRPSSKDGQKQVTKICLLIRKKMHEDTRKNYMFYVEGGRKRIK